jgi:hypothetical protein
MYDPDEFDIEAFRDAIRPHWMYHQPCNTMNWSVNQRPDSITTVEIAPPFQSVFGGAEDGKVVWSPFTFDIFGFLGEEGIDDIEKCGVVTFSAQDDHGPYVEIVGSFRARRFALRIHLEPQPETKPMEIVDRIKNEVRPIEEEVF